MNKIKTITALFAILFLLNACSKDDKKKKEEEVVDIETTDANGLQKAFKVTNGTLKTGRLPKTSSNANAPTIENIQTSCQTNAGYQLIVPFTFDSDADWDFIYLQVVGATNGYFSIKNTGSSSNVVAIPIFIPSNVLNGDFEITYAIVDEDGNVSEYVITTVVIKDALDCSNGSNSGSEGLTFTQVDMGNKAGFVELNYDTYTVPDRVDVFQGTTWLGGTGSNPRSTVPPLCDCDNPLPGFIGENSTISFNYQPSKGNIITIVVSGCLGGSTAWDWNISCPE